jgi:serine/threonine protein kinase/Tfp pilus assembly protein PilF
MTPARWQRINSLFQEALDHSVEERVAFLDAACAGDEAYRKQVQSLIACHERAQGFLETPALEAASGWLEDDEADSLVGKLIGSYKIEALLGAGGMGEVYLAEDTKLDRKVAIKFLPEELEEDDLARRRQIREAKAAAALDHPNICAIHEVAREANHSFIVMQYVEGETLAARIHRGLLPLSQSLDLAIEVADALSLAHALHIVHRDIKPQNIMITPRGQVKVLDFGLAKMVRPESSEQGGLFLENRLSETGVIIGTVPYMSPEQAKGEAVDARSDLFSLGAVLYECVTGKPAFSGNTSVEICAQVIHVDPLPPSQFNQSVPPQLDRVVLTALAKDRQSRHQTAGDLLKELRAVRDSLGAEDVVTRLLPPRPRRRATLTTAAKLFALSPPRILIPVFLVVLVALSVPFWWRATPHRPPPEASHWYGLGTAALRDGTYYKASRALENAIKFDDRFALAHARLAEAWGELDYGDKANHEILRARSLAGDLSPLPPLDSLYLQAITHVVLREFGPAVERYRKIAEQSPDAEKPHAYLDLGRAYENNDETEKAMASYHQAAQLASQDPAAFLRLGVLYGKQQEFGLAQENFQKAERLYQLLSNNEGAAEVFYQRGFFLKSLGKLSESRAELERALELTRASANQYQQIRTLQVLSGVAASEGDGVQAEQLAWEAIRLAQVNGMENQEAHGLMWLGNAVIQRGDYTDAEKYYQQALELARRNDGRLNEAWALFQLANLRSQQRNTKEALYYIEQALPFYKTGGNRKWLSQALTLLGRLHRNEGDYEAALQAFQEQLQRGEQVGDLSQVAFSHVEIGDLLAAQEQYSEALRHYDEGCKIDRSLDSKVSLGYALTARGGMLWQLGRYDEAKAALDEGSSIAERLDSAYKGLLASIHATNARLELSNWHFQASKSKSRQALDLAGTQFPDTAVEAKHTLGLAQVRSGEARAGTYLCEEAIALAANTGDPRLISGALLSAAEAMLESSDAQRALETAIHAQESFARFGQQDSEWRAWLIAAKAKRRLGDEAAAREYASNAEARLSSLAQKLGPEAYNGYLTRPDVEHFRKQLAQLVNP